MMEIAPISKGAAFESPVQDLTEPGQPRQPMGNQLTSVQPHPTPLIAVVEQPQAVVDDNSKQLHVAQMRADITGTGNIVDALV